MSRCAKFSSINVRFGVSTRVGGSYVCDVCKRAIRTPTHIYLRKGRTWVRLHEICHRRGQ